jgi:hypothetical protein
MAGLRWSVGRIALIWCAWPLVLLGIVTAVLAAHGGGSLDLLDGPWNAIGLLVMLVPPLVATLLWGRR